MTNKDTQSGGIANVSRRDFLKFSATAAAVGGALDFTFDPAKALAYESNANGRGTNAYAITTTTCPYCSASCGQRVVKAKTGDDAGKVIDIYGDFESPMNSGGLCAKGAGAIQLVNNPRRIGAWETATHPTGHNAFVAKSAATAFPASSTMWSDAGLTAYGATYSYADGVAYYRRGNQEWEAVPLPEAMKAAAGKLKTARGDFAASSAGPVLAAPATVNSVPYLGFSNLGVVAKADGKYFVGTGGVKVDATALGTALAALPGR